MRDFFAPECYAPFEGDNGGETAPGVTADTIKVVYYLGPDDDPIINYITAAIANDDTNADAIATLNTMRDYYEQFYELYGRTVDLQFFTGSGIASDEVAARADAVRIAEEIQPFAVLGGPALTAAFGDELSSRGIMCIAATRHSRPTSTPTRDPYNYGITASARQMSVHATEFISKQLAGKNAEYAGDEFTSTPRKFGLVYIESSAESAAIADDFVSQLNAEGIEIAERLPYQLDPATIQASAAQIIAKLKASGVTTVIFSGDPVAPGDFTRRGHRPGVLPGVVPRQLPAGRHDGVLPDLRPGTVAARVRHLPAERSDAARGERLLLAVPVVQRPGSAGERLGRRARAAARAVPLAPCRRPART